MLGRFVGFPSNNGETVVVLTAGTTPDPYTEEPAEDWSTATEREVVTTAPLEPRPSEESDLPTRNLLTNGWTLYLPEGDPISSRNRVRVRGAVYPVQGTPADWGPDGVVVQAYGTTG